LNALAWASLGYVGLALAHALWALIAQRERLLPIESLGVLLLASLVGALWPVSLEESAERIDESHGLNDRVRAALDFAGRPIELRSRFMSAAIQDAVSWADRISPAKAAPLRTPSAVRWVLLGLALLALVLVVPARKPAQPVANAPKPRVEKLLSDDDLEAFRAELTDLTQAQPLAAELRDERLRYQRLLEHLMKNDVGRADAIRELLALEKQLSADAEPSAAEGGLAELSRSLKGANEVLRKALEAENPVAAASELTRMSERVSNGDQSELARLRESLRKLELKHEQSDTRRARKEELESLLKRHREQQSASPEEKRLLNRQKRELEKLQRELAEQGKRDRTLDKLERDLADLSRAMGDNDREQAARELSEAAQDLARMAEQQGERQQREELARQLSQLRQLMQQGAASSQREDEQSQGEPQQGKSEQQGEQVSLEQTFLLRAKGQTGQGESQGERGKAGGSQGKPGADSSSPNGKPDTRTLELQRTGQADATLLVLGQKRVEVIGQSESPSREHDARTLERGTSLDGSTRDSRVTGTASKGPSRSETILDAADRGFATTDYRKVYTEYHGHAEQVLEQDEVPAGYRFYVRRYFQLIRPRDSER
jgi:hypothetical protein